MSHLLEAVDPLTGTVIGVAVILLIAYDIWVVWQRGDRSTISFTVLLWAARYPVLLLALGILIGHLVVPQYLPCAEQP